jgi:uncharacterized membrane protein YphA (DoxX/SURF4 family)
MNWLRLAGRSLLASHFVSQGIAALRSPSARVAAAEPLVTWANDLAGRLAPPALSRHLPRRTTTWVRLHGVTEAVGGIMMATGWGRRLGALLVLGSQVPHVIAAARRPADDRTKAYSDLAYEATLLGAVLIESLDTQGRPSLTWRAQQLGRRRRARPEPGPTLEVLA